MIIGFDGSRAFISERTGTENYSYQVLLNLAKIDHRNQYIIYTRQLHTQGWALQSRPKNFQFKQIKWPKLWTQAGLSIQTFRERLDVLFVPAHTLPIIRKPGLKTVVTVHDLGSEYLPATHQLKQRIYLSYMQRRQLTEVSKIIAVSEATKKDLVKKIGIKPENIKVIYEGYDQKLFKPVKGDRLVIILRQFRLKPGEYFLFVGTVQPRKNLERLIIAFSHQLSAIRQTQKKSDDRRLKTNDLQLVIAGSKGWLSDEIYQLPQKLGIEDKVKFLGYVPDKDLPSLYSGAITLIFPSLYEGFGLPILEAQACGCPVITSNISSMPEVAGKGAILVDPYSVDDIVKGMERVQAFGSEAQARRGTGYRVQLIKKGFENVKRFSWEKCAKETLKVLENVYTF